MTIQVGTKTIGLPGLLVFMADAEREHKLALVSATNRVAALSRTKSVRALKDKLNVSAKSLRKRVKVYRATLRKPRARLWAGHRIGIPLVEGGTQNKGVLDAPTPIPAFVATMQSGHKGRFYRSRKGGAPRRGPGSRRKSWPRNDTPISEVRINIKDASEHLMPGLARSTWRERFDDIYTKDFDRRLARGRRPRR